MRRMDVATNYEAHDSFHRAEEGGEMRYHGGETIDGEWSYSILLF
jgi:hypothetical protein